MTLAELLTSQRRWGRTRARKFLLGVALNENKRLGTLTAAPAGAARDRARREGLDRRLDAARLDAPGPQRRPRRPTLKERPPEAR